MCWQPLQGPFLRDRTLESHRCGATVVPAEKPEAGYVFLSNIKTKQVGPERRDSNGVFQQIPGGCTKRHLRRRTVCAFTTPWLLIVSLEDISPANLTDH